MTLIASVPDCSSPPPPTTLRARFHRLRRIRGRLGVGLVLAFVVSGTAAFGESLTKSTGADFDLLGSEHDDTLVRGDSVLLDSGTACVTPGCFTATGNSPPNSIGAGAHSIRNDDGTFLVVNGGNSCNTTLYDPNAGSPFSAGPSTRNPGGGCLPVSTGGHSFLRDDGLFVLVHGGQSSDTSLYNPVAESFSASPGLTGSFGVDEGANSVRILDDKFLVVHGRTLNETTVYEDTGAGYSTYIGPTTCNFVGGGAHSIALSSTRWLLIRGIGNDSNPDTCYLDYDSGSDQGTPGNSGLTFTNAVNFPGSESVSSGGHSIFYAADKFLLILGGGGSETLIGTITSSRGSPTVGWGSGPALSDDANSGAHSVLLPDGRFLIHHGDGDNTTSIFDPSDESIIAGPDVGPPPTMMEFGSHSLQADNGDYLLVAGDNGTDAFVYDAGFVLAGSYLSETIDPGGDFAGWNLLQFTRTLPPGTNLIFRVETSSTRSPAADGPAPALGPGFGHLHRPTGSSDLTRRGKGATPDTKQPAHTSLFSGQQPLLLSSLAEPDLHSSATHPTSPNPPRRGISTCEDLGSIVVSGASIPNPDNQLIRFCAQLSRSIPASTGSQQDVWLGESSVVQNRVLLSPALLTTLLNFNSFPSAPTALSVAGDNLTNSVAPLFAFSTFQDDGDDDDGIQDNSAASFTITVSPEGGGQDLSSGSLPCSSPCNSYIPQLADELFALPEGQYRFRAAHTDAGTPPATSPQGTQSPLFIIDRTPPVVDGAITRPTDDTLYVQPGSSFQILWTTSAITDANGLAPTDPLRLEFATDANEQDPTWQLIDDTQNDGSHTFTLPLANTDQAAIRLRATDAADNQNTDSSDPGPEISPLFTIDGTPPSVAAPSPDGELFDGNSTISVSWNEGAISDNFGLDTLELLYRVGGSGSFTSIDDTLQPNDSPYAWDPSALAIDSDDVELRLLATDMATNSASATSSSFTIDSSSPIANASAVTSPNGGELFAGGEEITVTWDSGALSDPPFSLPSSPVQLDFTGNSSGTISDGPISNSGSHPWTLPTAPGLLLELRVQLTLTDQVGLTAVDTSDALFTVDSDPPTSSISSPLQSTLYGPLNPWPQAANGTADDNLQVASAQFSVQRQSDGQFYNGASFQSQEIFLDATLTRAQDSVTRAQDSVTRAQGSALRGDQASFSLDLDLPDGVYSLVSRATDTAGNLQTSASSIAGVTIDTTPPTVVIDSAPLNNEDYPGFVDGTADDSSAGVELVEVSIQRQSDDKYWNGTVFVSGERFLAASGTEEWTLNFIPPLGGDDEFTFRARATDAIGNVSVLDTATLDFEASRPLSSIANLLNLYRAATWPGVIEGTAQSRPDTTVSVEIRIRQGNQFWNGSQFSSSEVWLPTTGTTSWSYAFQPPVDGGYIVSSRATDSGGLVQAPISSRAFTYDSTAPSIALDSPVEGSNSGVDSGDLGVVPLDYSAEDVTSGLDHLELKIERTRGASDPGSPHTINLLSARDTQNLDGDELGLVGGTWYRFTLNASDVAGNDSDQIVVDDWLYLGGLGDLLLVSAAAESGGDGSPGAPFRKIGDALAESDGDTTVLVLPGNYGDEAWPLRPPSGVEVLGAGPDAVILDGGGAEVMVELVQSQNVHLLGLALRNGGEGLFGGAIHAYGADATVVLQNLLITQCGVGIRMEESSLSLFHLTIANNDRYGIYARYPVGSQSQLGDNILASNGDAGIYSFVGPESGDLLGQAEYSDFFNDTDAASGSDLPAEPGNLFVDPRFKTPGSVFTLRSSSPARDAGDPSGNNNDPDGSRGDMGAFGGSFAVSEQVLAVTVSTPSLPLFVFLLTGFLALRRRRLGSTTEALIASSGDCRHPPRSSSR